MNDVPTTETLISFLVATTIFAYMPGPSTIYATARTIAGGKRAGWLAAIGIHVGGYAHVIAAALGLAVIFETTPILYLGLKLAGAVYLIWLGVSMFLSRDGINGGTLKVGNKTSKRAFWDSAVVEMLNPKTALFYLAFLPQFTDAAAALPIWGQLLILGTIVNVMFSSADVICVVLASRIMKFLSDSTSPARWGQRIGGTVLVGLGVRLAANHE